MNELPRYVFDTNLLLSAIISPDGNSLTAQAYEKAQKIGILVLSDETFAELSDVIFRGKFDRYLSDEKRFDFLENLRKVAHWVIIEHHVFDCRDPKDNKFLSLALAAQAALIVTGDDNLLILNPYQNIPICTAREFLEQ